MTSFEICSFEAFISEATPQAGSLEEAASAQEILIQQIESYLSRLSTALCTDMLTLENLTVDTFLQLTDTPASYVGQSLRVLRVNAAETGVEFTQLIHSSLTGLLADDHTQYLLLAGRAGGQTAIGGTAVSEELVLRGTTNANLGQIRCFSPIDFEDTIPANALNPYFIQANPVQTITAFFVGGGVNMSPTITFSNAVFIWEGTRISPNITSGVNPGFAAFTLLQALPVLRSTTAGFNPLNSLTLNIGVTMENAGVLIALTAATNFGISFSPQTRVTGIFSTMTVTNQTAVSCRPTFSTIANSTAALGTIRGLHQQNPSVALFQPQAGTETMVANIAVDVDNIVFGGNVTKRALRSALAPATNARFLENTGGAQSDFLAGRIDFSDNAGVMLGTGDDVLLNWNGAQLEFNPAVGTELRFRPDVLDYWEVTGAAALAGIQYNLDTIDYGTGTADPASANYFVRFTSPSLRVPTSAGSYADVLWIPGGALDINGLAMTDVSAFEINTPSILLSGGSIADLSNLFVDSMSSFGATRLQAFRVTGRSRLDGLMTHNEATLTQLTADVVQLSLPPNNLGRFVLLQDADALGPWTIRGILNVQVGDCFYIVNNGANAFLLGHQDGAAAAVDRIISPTGASLTLGTDEMAKLWYDPTASRWRILEHTGT